MVGEVRFKLLSSARAPLATTQRYKQHVNLQQQPTYPRMSSWSHRYWAGSLMHVPRLLPNASRGLRCRWSSSTSGSAFVGVRRNGSTLLLESELWRAAPLVFNGTGTNKVLVPCKFAPRKGSPEDRDVRPAANQVNRM